MVQVEAIAQQHTRMERPKYLEPEHQLFHVSPAGALALDNALCTLKVAEALRWLLENTLDVLQTNTPGVRAIERGNQIRLSKALLGIMRLGPCGVMVTVSGRDGLKNLGSWRYLVEPVLTGKRQTNAKTYLLAGV